MLLDNLTRLAHAVWQGLRTLAAALGETALREIAERLGLSKQVLVLLAGALATYAAYRLWRLGKPAAPSCEFCSC